MPNTVKVLINTLQITTAFLSVTYNLHKEYILEQHQYSAEEEFEQRFAWRKERQIYNLRELTEIAHTGGGKTLDDFPGLVSPLGSDNPIDALKWSIVLLWCEATENYVFGDFQSCILTCGAVVERCLKVSYEQVHGQLPPGSRWTLGRCIQECRGIVSDNVLDIARQMIEPRNNRAHALLEHSEPQLSIIGGPERGIEILSSQHYHIEPYRGEARNVIIATYRIMSFLFRSTP